MFEAVADSLKKERTATRRSLLAALLAMTLLAACSSGKLSNRPGSPVEMPEADKEAAKKTQGLEAPLYSRGGSSAQGKVSVVRKGEIWLVSTTLFGVLPGRYRMAFFDNGNCSSPNAFSAGKIWLPPNAPAGTPPDSWIPLLQTDAMGSVNAVFRLPNPGGESTEVFRKRSVLIFMGTAVEELKPGAPNAVVACGVFDDIQFLL